MTVPAGSARASWKWRVCGLLLLASTINYMDRQTLANASVRITREFHLSQEQYGNLELVFGWSFAVGSLAFGWLADEVAVRWLYPLALALWSLAGLATGFTSSYAELLVCRSALGLFEAGHWPCAVKATQRLLDPKERGMGNGLLQSGASIGAVVTPLLMRAMMTAELGSWRFTFKAIGLCGLAWICLWLWLVPAGRLGFEGGPGAERARFRDVLRDRRFLVVLATVCLINMSWQLLRAWLPKFLIEGRGYSESGALGFTSIYYIATDIGCLGAGAATLWLHRRGRSVHGARLAVFLGCALLTALSALAAVLPRGWPLLVVLSLMGAGALGVFPVYHALTQELTPVHQGRVTGLAGVATWALVSPFQALFGRVVDRTHSFDRGMAIIGWMPLAAFFGLWLFWKTGENAASASNGREQSPV
jgi:ACS family hexuronate transporter-like MFS transporter